ncbi:TPA: Ig-like domain-containing protein [Serratia fonticola]
MRNIDLIRVVKRRAAGGWFNLLQQCSVDTPNKGHHGPCPICGGTDRFHFIDDHESGEWHCRQCDAPNYGKPVRIYAVNIPVTGVTLDKSTLTVRLGESFVLTPTIAPASATNKAVTWTSSAPGNAMINASGATGNGNAVGVGTSTITVKTTDGAKAATCVVTVTA